MQVVTRLDLLVLPRERGQIRIRLLQRCKNRLVVMLYLGEKLLHQRIVLAWQHHARLPHQCFAAQFADLDREPLELLAGPGRLGEQPDCVVQQQRPEALQLAPDVHTTGGRLARNLVDQHHPQWHRFALRAHRYRAGEMQEPNAAASDQQDTYVTVVTLYCARPWRASTDDASAAQRWPKRESTPDRPGGLAVRCADQSDLRGFRLEVAFGSKCASSR